MRRILNVADDGLKWSQPRARKREFELRAASQIVATLKFRSGWGTFATAESADGCWTFKRIGFWQNRASIRACDSETDLAIFKNSTWKSGGTLRFADGSEFKATTNMWQTKLVFKSADGEKLMRLKRSGMIKRSAEVKIEPAAKTVRELPILVLFSWYLAIMLDSDVAASSAIAAGG